MLRTDKYLLRLWDVETIWNPMSMPTTGIVLNSKDQSAKPKYSHLIATETRAIPNILQMQI
eukprot:scaffold3851_cov182-Skeletonema_marinoi.AAC.1